MVRSSRVNMKMNSANSHPKLSDNSCTLAPAERSATRVLRRDWMLAAIWEGPGEMRVGEVPDATCPPDGVLLRVTACGICGTDVRAFFNGDRRISAGWVLGHEISGEVVEIGPEAGEEMAQAG